MTTVKDGETFDYIIVGSGISGLVVASFLFEDPAVSVLVVEAGADYCDDPSVLTPGFLASLHGNDKYDWKFQSVPQPPAMTCPRQGSCSAINFMAALYPSRANIDLWGQLGNSGWSWADLAPYYQTAATRYPISPENRDIFPITVGGYDGSTAGFGPLHVSYSGGTGTFNLTWMDSLTQWGFGPTDDDPASAIIVGAFQNLATIDPITKTRSYAATAYFSEEVRKRTNLVELTGTLVWKINLV